MDTLEGRLNIERTRLLYKFCEAEKGFQFRRHSIKKRGGQNVHALHVSKAELMRRLLSVYKAVSVVDRERTALLLAVISPNEGIKKADQHIFSDSLLETTISGQCAERTLQQQPQHQRMVGSYAIYDRAPERVVANFLPHFAWPSRDVFKECFGG